MRSQTYPHWELLVVDDASSDDTAIYLEQLARADPRVRPFRLDEQQRSSQARKSGMLARGTGTSIVAADMSRLKAASKSR